MNKPKDSRNPILKSEPIIFRNPKMGSEANKNKETIIVKRVNTDKKPRKNKRAIAGKKSSR